MTQAQQAVSLPVAAGRPRVSMPSWQWLGVAPFFLFALLFLVLPTAYLVVGAFQDPEGHFTLENIANLAQPSIVSAYVISLQVSAASALGGAIVGALLAAAVVLGRAAFAGADEGLLAICLAFAGGAVLASLADTLMPEAFEHGKPWNSFATGAGFFVSFMLAEG
jgi:ABC-type spermidine/putrescine transport system permease subunit II